jgi:hypothetical protein
VALDPAERQLRGVLDFYRTTLEPERRALLDRYQLVDFACKVGGVGSVGTRSWIAFLGRGRAAAHAGGERHLPRLGPGAGVRRADPRLLPAATAGLEGIGRDRIHGVEGHAGLWGSGAGGTLARAHARTGDRIAIAAYLGSGPAFDEAIGDFAGVYADQNERDQRSLTEAIASGRIKAESGL